MENLADKSTESKFWTSKTKKVLVILTLSFFALSIIIFVVKSFVDRHIPQPLISHFQGIQSSGEIEFVRQEYEEIVPLTAKDGKLAFLMSVPASIVGKMDMTNLGYQVKDSLITVTLPPVSIGDVLIELDHIQDYYHEGYSISLFLSGGGKKYDKVYDEIVEALKSTKKGVLLSALNNNIVSETQKQAKLYLINLSNALGYQIQFLPRSSNESLLKDLEKRLDNKELDKVKHKIPEIEKVNPIKKLINKLNPIKKGESHD